MNAPMPSSTPRVCHGLRIQHKRMCHSEWDNPAAEDESRRLVFGWAVSL